MNPASVAVSLLLAVQDVPVRPVWCRLALIGPVRDVGPSDHLSEDAVLIAEPLVHQFDGERRQVDSGPLASERFRSNACRGATAERIEHMSPGLLLVLTIRSNSLTGFWVG